MQRVHARRVEEEYAQTIMKNLYMPDGEKLPKIFIKAIPKNVTLVSVQVRRMTYHACLMYENTFLKVTEVQDCDIMSNTHGNFRIIAREPRLLVNENRLWWEVSVGHKRAEAVLQTNKDLEIGTYADWNPNVFMDDDVLKEMFNVTNEIVTRIDSIGHNTKGIPGVYNHSESSLLSTTAPSTAVAAPPERPFW